jgi:hypothetical protein
MNKFETLRTGLAISAVAATAGVIGTAEFVDAHEANVTASALCSDGIGADSASEGSINFFRFGDQVGKTVTTSVNGVAGPSHLVTFEETHNPDRKEGEPDFSISLQAPTHYIVKAAWGNNKFKDEGDLLACPEETPDTVVVVPPVVVPADTTPAATGDTTVVVVATDLPPAANQDTGIDTPILTPVTKGTLPATGKSHVAEKLEIGGTALFVGLVGAGIGSARRRNRATR